MVGGEMAGNWASGRVHPDVTPARMMTMDSTAAKIGRSMKNREITGDAPSRAAALHPGGPDGMTGRRDDVSPPPRPSPTRGEGEDDFGSHWAGPCLSGWGACLPAAGSF